MPRAPRTPKPNDQTPENPPDPNTLPPVTGGEDGEPPTIQYVGSEGEVLATREDVAADLAMRPRNELDVIAETMELSVADGTTDDDLRALILANLAFADDVKRSEEVIPGFVQWKGTTGPMSAEDAVTWLKTEGMSEHEAIAFVNDMERVDPPIESPSPYVLVRATSDEARVVLFERDSLHPDGEAFVVSDGREVLVGETWGVLQAIRAGTIERV